MVNQTQIAQLLSTFKSSIDSTVGPWDNIFFFPVFMLLYAAKLQ